MAPATIAETETTRSSASSSSATGRAQVFARVRAGSRDSSCLEARPSCQSISVRVGATAQRGVVEAGGYPAPAAGAASAASETQEARRFQFDGVFDGTASQREVFKDVGLPVLRDALEGRNGTILAYGQTGSGKTHSIFGSFQDEDAGILPRVVAALFLHIAQDTESVFEVEAAAMQVYNEQVDDLLDPDPEAGGLNLSVMNGGSVPGLTWIRCSRPEKLLEAMARARDRLIYAETRMNKASSRSHAVFQLGVRRRDRVLASASAAEGSALRRVEWTHACLNIVDLAGSERVKRTGAEGTQLREASAINRSLLAFGNVVSALAAKRAHVPFRESKLTRILEGSLGGNCKTCLLVCVSDAQENMAETLGTLEFASRALRVETDARVNRNVIEMSADAIVEGSPLAFLDATLRAGLDDLRDGIESERQESARLRGLLQETEAELRILRVRLEAETMRADSASEKAAASECDERRKAEQRSRESEEMEVALREAREEAQRWRLAAEAAEAAAAASAAEVTTAEAARDAAQACAERAEAQLEEELEAVMDEIEASDERASRLQQAAEERFAAERDQLMRQLAALRSIEETTGKGMPAPCAPRPIVVEEVSMPLPSEVLESAGPFGRRREAST